MKVAIITFHGTRSYGAVLQAYAMQTFLEKTGHEPFFINYIYRFEDFGRGLVKYLIERWRLPQSLVYGTISYFHHRLFSHFCMKHLNIADKRYEDYQQLQRVPPLADVYICGSDQVWNPHLCRFETDEHVSWLDFGDLDVRRVSYAASFAVRELDDALCKRWSVYAKRFHAVSVREKDGIKLLNKLGRDDAVFVPDPTLLIDPSDYDAIESQLNVYDSPYFFFYQIGPDNTELASKVKSTVSQVLQIPCFKSNLNLLFRKLLRNEFIGPSHWLSLLRQSRFVITNSFHGLTFSLIFHRPFIVMLRSQQASQLNSRFTSLLEVVGLQDRAVNSFDQSYIKRLCREEIDWPKVNARIMEFREMGFRFINEALS